MTKKNNFEQILNKFNKTKDELNESSYIETNILPLDILKALSNGSFVQIAGETNTYKTRLALLIAFSYCKNNQNVLYIDADNSINKKTLSLFKLNEYLGSSFYIFKESSFDEVENIIDGFISNLKPALIIIDALPSLINNGYVNLKHEGRDKGISISNNNSNYESRPLNLFIRKYKAVASKQKVNFLLINNLRNKVAMPVGTVVKRYGPKCIDYSCSIIFETCTISKKHKYNDFATMCNKLNGNVIGLKVVKNSNGKANYIIPIFISPNLYLNTALCFIYYKKKMEDMEIIPLTESEIGLEMEKYKLNISNYVKELDDYFIEK